MVLHIEDQHLASSLVKLQNYAGFPSLSLYSTKICFDFDPMLDIIVNANPLPDLLLFFKPLALQYATIKAIFSF